MLYEGDSRGPSGRFCALVLDGHDADAAVPLPLGPFGVYQWPRDRELVLRRAFGLPPAAATPLGSRPPLVDARPASAGLAPDVAPTSEPTGEGVVLPPGLAEAYLAGDLVAFVGADVPLAAGLPAGDALPVAVLRHARAYLDPAAADELATDVQAALVDHAPAEALGLLAHELDRPTFNGIIADLLDDQRRPSPIPALATAIADLSPTLRGILTTNVDHLLERALLERGLADRWTRAPRPTATLDERPHWLAHLRGALPATGPSPRRTCARASTEGPSSAPCYRRSC